MPRRISADGFRRGSHRVARPCHRYRRRNAGLRWHPRFHHVWHTACQKGRLMTYQVYTAGKIWHAPKFQALRSDGYGVNARWIDLDDDCDIVKNRKDLLWQICFEDVRDCDFVLLYCEDMSEEQRGALVEIGMAYGFDKPVYAVGTCKQSSRTRYPTLRLPITQGSIGFRLLICRKAWIWQSRLTPAQQKS